MRRTAYPAGLLALALALAACDAASPDTAVIDNSAALRGPERIAVCLYNEDAGAFKLVMAPAPAAAAHLRRGAGVPGGEVPGSPGYVFDENCTPTSTSPFTCDTEEGTGNDGRKTFTITHRVTDPASLPVALGDAFCWFCSPSNNIVGMEAIVGEDPSVMVGMRAVFAWDPSEVLLEVATKLFGPNIPEAGFVCGPYAIGATP